MGSNRVGIVAAPKGSFKSPKEWGAAEWDAARVRKFGIGQDATVKQERPAILLEQALQEMHWISIVCFLQEMDHINLKLTSELASRVGLELAKLRKYDPLEAYVAGLVHLCIGEQKGEAQGAVSLEDSFHAEY